MFYDSDQSVLGRMQATDAQAAYRQSVPVDQGWVDLLNKYYDAYPQMDSSVAVGLAKAGIQPTDPAAQQIAAGSVVKKAHEGIFDRLGDVLSPVKDIAGKVLSPVAHAVGVGVQAVDQTLSPVIKGATRTAFVALETPLQEVQDFSRAYIKAEADTWKDLSSPLDILPIPGSKLIKNFQQDAAFAGTSSGVESISDLIAGKKVDLGTGYLPGGQVEQDVKQQANQLQLKIGDVQLGGPGHPSITAGRVIAAAVSEPGSKPFNVISGLTDAGVAWFGDPVQSLAKAAQEGEALTRIGRAVNAGRDERSLGAAVGELRTTPSFAKSAAEAVPVASSLPAPDGLRTAADQLGLLPGVRNTVDVDTTAQWGSTAATRRVAERIAATDDFATLRAATKKQIPTDLLVKLTDAQTPQEVVDLVQGAAGAQLASAPEFLGFKAQRANSTGFRIGSHMPSDFLDPNNLDQAVEQWDRWARNAKLPADLRNSAMGQIARSPGREAMVSTMDSIMGSVADHLVNLDRPLAAAVSPERARNLTQLWSQSWENTRRYFVDEIGENRKAAGVMVNGTPIETMSPFLPSEYLDSVVPLPDPREMRRATSNLATLVDNPFFTRTTGALDNAQNAWKKLTVMRGSTAVRILGETQIGMSGAGYDSMFLHPLHFIAALTGADSKLAKALGSGDLRQADILGQGFYNDVGEAASTQLKSVLHNGWAGWAGDEVFDRGYSIFNKGDDGYPRAWAQSIGNAYTDPVLRQVASTPVNLDTAKTWWWAGDGADLRKRLVTDQPQLATREGADAYIDTAAEGLRYRTNSDPTLLDAIATGKINGERIGSTTAGGRWRLNPALEDHLATVDGPAAVKGQELHYSSQKAKVWDNVTSFMFSHLLTEPTNKLVASPIFRQAYYNRLEEMVPFMDDATRAQALKGAQGVVDDAQFARMAAAPSKANRTITDLASADQLAKTHAVDATKALMHDLTNKSQFADTFRLISPFAEPWKQAIQRWAGIVADNPNVVRRGQQIVTGAQGNGFFHKDVNGEEVFTFPFSRNLTKTLTGIPFDINGRVSGLSLMTEVLPGVGPVMQVSAAALLPETPDWNFVRDAISPYGEQDYSKGILEAFLPGYARNIAQFFQKGDPRLFANTVKDTGDYLASTGDYDLKNPDSVKQWHDDSVALAKKVYLLRGLVQFGAPTAPMPQFLVEVNKGAQAKAKLDESPGRIAPGNINLDTRPQVKNPDGSVSTVRSITITDEKGHAVVIPTVVGSAVVSNEEAIAHYKQTGENLGTFDNEKNAETFAEALHNQQAGEYANGKPPTGHELAITQVVLNDLYRMQQDPSKGGVGFDNAIGEFLNRYGTSILPMAHGGTLSIPPKLPVTQQSADWVQSNPGLVHDFGLTWGLFAPQGDGQDFDYAEYTRQLATGDRVSITPEQRLSLAQASVGRYLYLQAQSKVSAKPTKVEREWLAAVKARIGEEYPGYKAVAPGLPGGARSDQVISELSRAVDDPRLADTQLAKITKYYLTQRQAALDYAQQIGVKTLGAAAAAPARDWLGQIGAALTNRYPEFQEMFDTVFSREVT